MSRQSELAQIMADELEACGHDQVTGTDILDALASCGMELIQPPDPATADNYHDSLTRGMEDEDAA